MHTSDSDFQALFDIEELFNPDEENPPSLLIATDNFYDCSLPLSPLSKRIRARAEHCKSPDASNNAETNSVPVLKTKEEVEGYWCSKAEWLRLEISLCAIEHQAIYD